MKIFLSYGHDRHAYLSERIKRDLEQDGHEVWFDKDMISASEDWEYSIEKGIKESEWLVLIMTEHSVRRPDGVCLDEVSHARYLGKKNSPDYGSKCSTTFVYITHPMDKHAIPS